MLYTVTEAASQLGVGRSTLYRLLRSGEAPYQVMRNRQIKLSADDINAARQLLTSPIAVHRPEVA